MPVDNLKHTAEVLDRLKRSLLTLQGQCFHLLDYAAELTEDVTEARTIIELQAKELEAKTIIIKHLKDAKK